VAERKSYSEGRIFDLSRQTGRSPPTLRRWARTIDLDDPEALQRYMERMDGRKPPVERNKNRNYSRVRNWPAQTQVPPERARRPSERSDEHGNGEIPVQQTGAAFALKRLELEESQAFGRLQRALVSGSELEIEQCQLFWVRLVESLRKLDLSIELGRRDAEEQVSKKLACDVALAIADWLRISFAVFLSSEVRPLMGFRDVGEFKHYAFERFRSILHLTVHNSLSTNSPIPDWAAQKVRESWNVQEP
jgi:hypothetical protein